MRKLFVSLRLYSSTPVIVVKLLVASCLKPRASEGIVDQKIHREKIPKNLGTALMIAVGVVVILSILIASQTYPHSVYGSNLRVEGRPPQRRQSDMITSFILGILVNVSQYTIFVQP